MDVTLTRYCYATKLTLATAHLNKGKCYSFVVLLLLLESWC